MKRFIPLILIVAITGTFIMLSFSSYFSKPKQADAQIQAIPIIILIGKTIWQHKGLITGIAIGSTVLWGSEKIIDMTLGRMLALISDFTWFVSARLFTLSGYLLDYAVDFSVKDFKQNIDNIGVINQGYKIILNVANMIFIFILLYIAINTILGIGGGDIKKLLTNVIIVALLINFSLFMAKVIIDASNIIAMGFYNAVQTETISEGEQKAISVGSVSTAMMAGLRLQTLIPSPQSAYNEEDPDKGLTNFNIAMNQFGGSALFLVSAFAFFSAAFLFITRFIALLFYMILSPVAFLGYISPELKGYSSKWWKGLQSQAIFAPVFLFFAYLISSIVNSGKLWEAVGGNSDPSSNFYDVISSSGRLGFPIIMNYAILTALMYGGLIAAKKMASEGSSGIVKYADDFRGWAQGVAGRNFLGRPAHLVGDSDKMAEFVARHPTVGGFVKNRFDSVAGVSFGGAKGGYTKALKDSVEQKRKTADWLKYKGKDEKYTEEEAKKIREEIEKEKEAQKKRNENMPGLRESAASAREKYDKSEKEREKWQKEYDTYPDAAIAERLKQAKEKAERAKQEFEQEEKKLTDEEKKTKESEKIIETGEQKLKETPDKWKTVYKENLKFKSNILNKLFPSGAKAAEEIRKGKKPIIKIVQELMEETGEIPKKAEKEESKKD